MGHVSTCLATATREYVRNLQRANHDRGWRALRAWTIAVIFVVSRIGHHGESVSVVIAVSGARRECPVSPNTRRLLVYDHWRLA